VTLAVAVAGCASNDEAGLSGYPDNGPREPGAQGGSAEGAGGAAPGEPGSELPPEQEVESSYESPVATGRYVWIANPTSGRVAYVDAATLEVRTTEAGHGPKYLAAVPNPQGDVAIVINQLSQDATLLRARGSGAIDTATVPIAQQSNAWAISASGRWAIAWTEARRMVAPSAAQGFQDITVIDATEGSEAATRLSVGYRPVAMSFSADETTAYAVTQDGISVVELDAPGGPQAIKVVAISDDPLEDPGTRDVTVTPDGAYALVRRDGSSQVTLVALSDDTRTQVTLPGPVTDLDLSPQGNQAIAVIREQGQVAILPIPGIVQAPDAFQTVTVQDAIVGSVAIASNADVALLYSNASEQQRVTSLRFDTTPAFVETLKLHAAVLAVFLAPSGASGIVLHNGVEQPESSYKGAFSLLNLAPKLPAKIVGTLAEPTAVAVTPSGAHALVAERNDTTRVFGAYLIRTSNQQVDRYELASPPIAVGAVVQANRAFVAQEHPKGRITFLDLDTGQARTLTGFELGAMVVDGD
jgi:DNA-binding beta-propeller fold protein YncE